MEIINPNNHPIIKRIKACPNLKDEVKQVAIKDIARMITDAKYRKEVDAADSLNEFMKCDDLVMAFNWNNSEVHRRYKDDLGCINWARIHRMIRRSTIWR